jgi:hypothetical protein
MAILLLANTTLLLPTVMNLIPPYLLSCFMLGGGSVANKNQFTSSPISQSPLEIAKNLFRDADGLLKSDERTKKNDFLIYWQYPHYLLALAY